ncbi:LacI family DNA-binding transcriptional regulator [Demequina sp.]|uniref:LacI family DNA-binding transcriptional regulator n=1 Tax=Demequina sp. TaxID=2050685 RepID=UPI003A88A5FE
MSGIEPTSPVTLHDVAREAGVSLATASRSLNGSTRNVKESNRQLVVEAAARLGYTPNASAQAVARGTTTTVSLLVGDITDPYFSTIASGVVRAATRHGLVVTMTETERDAAREVELVRAMRGQRPRAIILAASRLTGDPHAEALSRELSAYEAAGGHVVFISSAAQDFRCLPLPHREGAFALGERLHALGYRHPAVLAGPRLTVTDSDGEGAVATVGLRTSDERLAGFADAFAQAGAPIPAERIVPTAFTRDGGYDGMRRMIEEGLGEIDVVFAVNDVMAVGAMSALRDCGLTPGEDIAVAGFDDIPTLRDVTPRLTSVALPLADVGAHALELALADGDAHPAAVSCSVELRESTPAR